MLFRSTIADKSEAEAILLAALTKHLDAQDKPVMLKLSLPNQANLYRPLTKHKNVMRVVALSGGYPRDVANHMLNQNDGMIASFSRALAEGLSFGQSDTAFNKTICATIDSIFAVSKAG